MQLLVVFVIGARVTYSQFRVASVRLRRCMGHALLSLCWRMWLGACTCAVGAQGASEVATSSACSSSCCLSAVRMHTLNRKWQTNATGCFGAGGSSCCGGCMAAAAAVGADVH